MRLSPQECACLSLIALCTLTYSQPVQSISLTSPITYWDSLQPYSTMKKGLEEINVLSRTRLYEDVSRV